VFEGAALATVGGAAVFTGISVSVAPAVVAGAAAGGIVGGAAYAAASSTGSGSGNSSSGNSGTSSRDVHGQLRSAERKVDTEKVCSDGDLYYQDDGQIVRVLHNGDGTIDVVVRDPSNPSGRSTTEIAGAKESYLERKLASGKWFE
jgi:hypothetical protein